jgi:hypothetical protein
MNWGTILIYIAIFKYIYYGVLLLNTTRIQKRNKKNKPT